MKKLKLDDLQVESFVTTRVNAGMAGTVQAHQESSGMDGCVANLYPSGENTCYCPGQTDDEYSCNRVCVSAPEHTCWDTCQYGGSCTGCH
jgi:hypothetical protein